MNSPKPPPKIHPIKTLISDLPTTLTQSSLQDEHSTKARVIIIGDVHGMRKSLSALLDKINFSRDNGDKLILTGDLVNKGPDSPGVVDLAIELGASAVRGNHENAVLNAAAESNNSKDDHDSQPPPVNSEEDLTGSTSTPENPPPPPDKLSKDTDEDPKKDENEKPTPGMKSTTTASLLSQQQLDWLAALPLIIRMKLPPSAQPSSLGETLLVVHAGLVPGIPLEDQDPHAVMHMRSLVPTPSPDLTTTLTPGENRERDSRKFTPAEATGEEGWVVEWDRWQDGLTSKTTVVFGHDAKRRLQVGRWSIGLDSACLYGNQLSAVVVGVDGDGVVGYEIVQVDCVDVPVAPTMKEGEGKVGG